MIDRICVTAFRANTRAELNIQTAVNAVAENAASPKLLQQGSGRQAVRLGHLKLNA
jgi:hypothetical protein